MNHINKKRLLRTFRYEANAFSLDWFKEEG